MGISNPRDWVQSGLGKVSKSEKKNMNVVVYLVNLGVTAYMLRIVNVGGVMWRRQISFEQERGHLGNRLKALRRHLRLRDDAIL